LHLPIFGLAALANLPFVRVGRNDADMTLRFAESRTTGLEGQMSDASIVNLGTVGHLISPFADDRTIRPSENTSIGRINKS
jgi:hypothetical protein